MEFAWKTRTEKTSVNGLPRVFFCSGKKAYDDNFDVLSGDILEYVNCVIYHVDYENIPGSMSELTDELVDDLQEMQIIVVPVTKELFTEEDAWVRDVIKAVKGKKIILPIMMGEVDLWNEFEPLFGSVQFLDKYNLYGQAKGTEISYEKKLEKRLKEFLVGDELAAKVREAFDAKIFLSYRKKDRREAQELMRLIHSDPKCESIAIWYDEFLVPGEDYNEDIKKALESSNALVFNVTQSFNEPGNYVLRVEYPAAQEQEKKIISVEMSDTDIEELEHNFKGIGDSLIKIDKHEKVCKVTLDALKGLVKDENSNDMKHTFFLGLAYKNGLEVEVDDERGNRLIERAAKGGLPEAMEEMARLCFYVRNEFETAIDWQRKAVEAFKGVIESDDDGMDAFLGFQRAVMNVMGMAKETRIDVSEWVYAIVEDVAAGYCAKVKEQPEKYREQFVKMQYLRIEVVRWYFQQIHLNRRDFLECKKQEKKVKAIKNNVDDWLQLCKGTNSNQDNKNGSLEDEQFVVDIYCTIGDRTGYYIGDARNAVNNFLSSFDKELSDEQKCNLYIKCTKPIAKWEVYTSNCSNKKIGIENVEDEIPWFCTAQKALELCDAHKEDGKLDKAWSKQYWDALYVIASQLFKVAKTNFIEDDIKDKIEEYINESYNIFGAMYDSAEGDDVAVAEQRRTVVKQMIGLLIAKIELDNLDNQVNSMDYNDANSIYIGYLKELIGIAKNMTKDFKDDREIREFYVRQLVYCAKRVWWVKEFADDAEREARQLCMEEKTVQTKEWLRSAIDSKFLFVVDESEKNKLKSESETLKKEIESGDDKKHRINTEEKLKAQLNDKTDRYDGKMLDDLDCSLFMKARYASEYCLPKYKGRKYDKDNLEMVKEDLAELDEMREVLDNKDWYIAILRCLFILKYLQRAKALYVEWNVFVERELLLKSPKWKNPDKHKGYFELIASGVKSHPEVFKMEDKGYEITKKQQYCIENGMAELYDQAEDYEAAKIHWKKAVEFATDIVEYYQILESVRPKGSVKLLTGARDPLYVLNVNKWENERKKIEDRIAACDEKLKG